MDTTRNVDGSVNVTEVERLLITVITDNYYDALRPDATITKRFRTQPGQWMHAEHGLSFFIEASSNGRTSGFMFDYGLDAQGVHKNMDVLGIDVGKAVGFGLSHGHFDHWTGLTQFLTLNRSKIQNGVPPLCGRRRLREKILLRAWYVEQVGYRSVEQVRERGPGACEHRRGEETD